MTIRTMKEFDEDLDQAAHTPKQKTPEEMQQNPAEALENDAPHDDENTSGAAEGAGKRKYGINNNDSNEK